ncbi:hypothetical protein F5Y13DRAFT_85076 [Hypoxylon sp. FL1857]|nr:hypothetical protein F5Y13DRAFT_85076 [Hypoxylon sp. FL1857]
MNDPDFVPDTALPKYDLDALLASSQQTNKSNSQMSPLDSTVLSGSRSPGSRSLESAFNVQLDLNRSDSSAPRRSPFGLQGLSSAQKPEGDELILPQAHDFAGAGDWGMDMDDDGDDYAGAGDWGMEIDENGNITELGEPAIVQDEPDLPRFPSVERDNQAQANQEQQDQSIMDDQGDIVMMDTTRPEAQPKNQAPYEHDLSDDDARPAPSRPKRKPRTVLFDEVTQLSRSVIHDWQADYLKNCATKKARRTPAAVSKANAMLLTFGFGLSNVGRELSISGMSHPLVRQFSGDALFTALTGLNVPEQPHGTRRSASEPIEDGDEQDGRRVRPRVESDFDQQGRGMADDGVGQGAQTAHGSPEVGRDAQAAMSDNMSSALRMPWNRGSSLVPGSSIRGSAQKGRIPSSPPANRDNIQDPALFSDGASFGGDDFDFGMGGPPSDDSFGGLNLAPEPKPDAPAPEEGERPSVDIEGANFLSYVGSAARENGERRLDEDEDVDRRWVAFDDVFVPKETTRETAAQAFYNALSLVSKGKMNVQQDGEVNEPFGDIWVGVKMGDRTLKDE